MASGLTDNIIDNTSQSLNVPQEEQDRTENCTVQAELGPENLRITVFGRTGEGKSSTLNTILGRPAFKVGNSPFSITNSSSYASCMYNGRRITVVDTPGIHSNTQAKSAIEKELKRTAILLPDGVHCFIICMNMSICRFDIETEEMLKAIKVFGDNVFNYCLLVYNTPETELEYGSLEDFLVRMKKLPQYQKFLQKINDRVIAVNNVTSWGRFRVKLANNIDRNLATSLSTYFEFEEADAGKLSEAGNPGLEIVRLMNSKNLIKAGDISPLLDALTDIEQEGTAKKIAKLHNEIMGGQSRPICTGVNKHSGRIAEYSLRVYRGLRPSESRELRNIVVVGKTGAGKSSTVNLLLGRDVVEAKSGPNPVTMWSSCATGKYENNTITVADTPGIGDKTQDPKEVMKQLARVAFLLRDGIHCYIICLNASEHRFTDSTREMLEKIKTMGEESVYGWCMVLYTRAEAEFTHQSLDAYLGAQKKHKYLQTFFEAIEDRVVAVNTKTTDQTEKEQNRESIIAMVDKVIENNERENRNVFNGGKLFRKAKEAYEAVASEVPPGRLNPVLISAIIETMIQGSVSDNTSETRFAQSVLYLISQSETCSATRCMLTFNFDEDEYRISHDELKSQVKQIFEKIKEKETVLKKALRKAYKTFCLRSEVE